MQYGNIVSLALTANLPDSVFIRYGITCSYDPYNADTVYNSLVNGMPVIVRADGTVNYYSGECGDGHCFIIDGCKSYRIHSTYYYEWVWENGHGGVPVPCLPEMVVEQYSSPIITHFKMNWGWAGDSDHNYNNDYFAKSGNWEVTLNGNQYNFIYNREMIYDFAADL